MAKKTLSILILMVMFTFVAIMPGSIADVQAEVIKVSMIGTLPVGHHLTKALEMYKKYVEENSNGRVQIDIYPAQQLYNDKDLVSVLPRGAVDMAIANLDMWTGLVPAAGFFFIPMMFKDEDDLFRAAHGVPGDILAQNLENCNVKAIGWCLYDTISMIFKDPVVQIEDFKGKRMRAYGQTISYFEEALGASPTMMSSGEVYQALQKGTIDGAMSGITSFDARKWYEVAKHVPDVTFTPYPYVIVANLKFWNSLPEDLQKVFLDGAITIEEFTKKAAQEAHDKSRDVCEKNGVVFDAISDEELARWRQVSVPILMKKFKENFDPKEAERMFVYMKEN
ncbi:MAG: TRAP transporter substrate-binding protein DctP [Deltaproteobacteria bacterium]|nr:TRAP transporter substrate-binding protein DctP [Deltaproteobacteria bacterium]